MAESSQIKVGRRLRTVKRLSPVLILAAAAAIIALLWRGDDEAPLEEAWKPVEPS